MTLFVKQNYVRFFRGLKSIVILTFLISACNEEVPIRLRKVKFAFNHDESVITGGRTNEVAEPHSLLISISNNAGSVVEDETISLAKFGTQYITSSGLELAEGIYNVTKFLILNSNGDVLLACPLEGSPKAYLVSDPLPVQFEVSENEVSEVLMEVIAVIEDVDSPADFGYGVASFTFDEVETFSIDARVIDHHSKTSLSTSVLVEGFGANHVLQLEKSFAISGTGLTEIELPANVVDYRLVVEVDGYYPIEYFLTKTQLQHGLKCCEAAPTFTIEMVPIDYYHRLEVSNTFKGTSTSQQRIFSYLPVEGCTNAPWIDFGGFAPGYVSIVAAVEDDQSNYEEVQTVGFQNDFVGGDFFGVFSLPNLNTCSAFPQASFYQTSIYVDSGPYELMMSFTWDKTLQAWTASQFVGQNTYNSSQELFYQTYSFD